MHFTAGLLTVALCPQPFLAERFVEIIEHLSASRYPLRVIRRGQCDTVDQGADADSFVATELAIPQIDIVNDFRDGTKCRVLRCNTIEQHLKRALVAHVRE